MRIGVGDTGREEVMAQGITTTVVAGQQRGDSLINFFILLFQKGFEGKNRGRLPEKCMEGAGKLGVWGERRLLGTVTKSDIQSLSGRGSCTD